MSNFQEQFAREFKINDGYVLPHPLDREEQQETFEKVLEALDDHRVVIVEGPTGVGKTAWIAALSLYYRVMALTFTKSLQDQYSEKYGFVPLFGLGSYRCGKHKTINAGTCNDLYNGTRPCVEYADFQTIDHNCPYRIARSHAVCSNRLVTNVAKFLIDTSISDDHTPEVVTVDECHLLSDYIIDYTGSVLKWRTEFYSVQHQEFQSVGHDSGKVKAILLNMQVQMLDNCPKIENEHDFEGLKGNKKWRELNRKIELLMSSDLANYYLEGNRDNLIVKSLSPAKFFRSRILKNEPSKRRVILMSATPGRPEHTANAFGLEDGEWAYVKGTDPYTPEQKAIKVIKTPFMTGLFIGSWLKDEARRKKIKEVEHKYTKHTQAIADEIKTYPDNTQGLITVTSYNMAYELQKRLASHGINTFVPTRNIGTNKQLQEAYEKLSQVDSDRNVVYRAVISCTFNEGVDFGNLYFVIMGKVPFPYIGDGYSKARKAHDSNWYMGATASTMKQIWGRNRRKEADFEIGAKVVVIADASYKSVLPYFEDNVQKQIIPAVSRLPRPRKGFKLKFK